MLKLQEQRIKDNSYSVAYLDDNGIKVVRFGKLADSLTTGELQVRTLGIQDTTIILGFTNGIPCVHYKVSARTPEEVLDLSQAPKTEATQLLRVYGTTFREIFQYDPIVRSSLHSYFSSLEDYL